MAVVGNLDEAGVVAISDEIAEDGGLRSDSSPEIKVGLPSF
jgi:hypothetical protein